MSELKKIQLYVNSEVYEEFKRICKSEGIPAAIRIRELMKNYVKENSYDERSKDN